MQVTGQLDAWEEDRVALRVSDAAEPMILPRTTIVRLEMSGGRRGNALVGGIVGFVIGGGIGLAGGLDMVESGFESSSVPMMVVLVGSVGAAIGALIGESTKSERWEDVPGDRWRLRLQADGTGGVAIGVNLGL